MGNGKLCAYGQGPDILQLFGPPYSSPSLIGVDLGSENITVHSKRIPQTAVWEHSLSCKSEFTDFVDWDAPCFVRMIKTLSPLTLNVKLENVTEVIDNTKQFESCGISGGYLLYAQAGAHFYNDYPLNKKTYFQLLLSGGMKHTQKDDCIEITINNDAELYIVGGVDYPEVCLNTEKVIKTGSEAMLNKTMSAWKAFSARKNDFMQELSDEVPLRSELSEMIDAVAVCIKAQQAEDGGVLAGHRYHMAYVRDQYGVFRGLLKLGYNEEAKGILSFYWNIWKRKGFIACAQPMGEPSSFHVHENDDVEITGYMILQAFDYLSATSDEAFLKEIYPMLRWAFDSQKKHLIDGMLPFNGDETYIAGGVLPRSCINDGSADATMLFIAGGEKLVDWLEENRLCSESELSEDRAILLNARNRYRDNFFKDGIFITNNPERKRNVELPRFRHGACEVCCVDGTALTPVSFGWLEKNGNDRYLCPLCSVGSTIEHAGDNIYSLQSVSLIPLYIRTNLIAVEEISDLVEVIAEQYKKTGNLPSRPDGDITVGYDYGLLLYTLAELDHPLADEIYKKTLSILDSTSVWVEYYVKGKPYLTRCRAWESAINLEAVIHYIGKKYCQ